MKSRLPERAYTNLEFLYSPEARTIMILSEYLEPEYRLRKLKVNSTILFLGSSRINPSDRESPLSRFYWEAEELAFRIAKWAIPLKPKGKNFVICTGAGPGVMEAANRGAARAGGKTIGMNISLPDEQQPNRFISPELSFIFHYFFMRKFWLIYKSRAVVAFPGGFGTLDEVFEIMTLVQTGKIRREDIFILLYGEDYWRKIVDFDALAKSRAISSDDRRVVTFASSPSEAFLLLKKKLGKTI